MFAGNIIGKPISRPQYAYEVIKQRANIKNPDEVVLHTARHSVASNLISNGADISAVQKLLNHRCIESTLRYAKLSEGKQRETSQRLSSLITDYNPLDTDK
ncbi:tyrosine-type recombinase/integrase [Photobacterium leiognathi]|uniref:tyrosine-type recombinase/integrase n=1 Tax=Photobacterium leiognathi TaxID=553611 RepID=UPI00076A8261|nr:tyrosine-type recombinase/integrase [Photobacterium leiognathi]